MGWCHCPIISRMCWVLLSSSRRWAANWCSWMLVVCPATRAARAVDWSSSRSMPVVNATSAVLTAAVGVLEAGVLGDGVDVVVPAGVALDPQAASAMVVITAVPMAASQWCCGFMRYSPVVRPGRAGPADGQSWWVWKVPDLVRTRTGCPDPQAGTPLW